jgi:hypothetical protein
MEHVMAYESCMIHYFLLFRIEVWGRLNGKPEYLTTLTFKRHGEERVMT